MASAITLPVSSPIWLSASKVNEASITSAKVLPALSPMTCNLGQARNEKLQNAYTLKRNYKQMVKHSVRSSSYPAEHMHHSARSSLYPALVAGAPLVLVRVEDVFDELPALHQLLISTECDGQLQWLEEVIKLKCVAAVRRRQVPPEGISLFGLPVVEDRCRSRS